MERLWKVAWCFFNEATQKREAHQWVEERLRRLLEGKVDSVIRGMRYQSTQRGLKGPKRKTVRDSTEYFERNRARMRYDEYLAAGFPIGSGVVEGACRHLVKDRMERTGMRWIPSGARRCWICEVPISTENGTPSGNTMRIAKISGSMAKSGKLDDENPVVTPVRIAPRGSTVAKLLNDLRELIHAARGGVAQAVNSALVLLYWQVGQRIQTEILKSHRAGYGEQIVATLASRLAAEFGQGFAEKNLRRMIQLAAVFPDREIVVTLSRQLGWSHFLTLLVVSTKFSCGGS